MKLEVLWTFSTDSAKHVDDFACFVVSQLQYVMMTDVWSGQLWRKCSSFALNVVFLKLFVVSIRSGVFRRVLCTPQLTP